MLTLHERLSDYILTIPKKGLWCSRSVLFCSVLIRVIRDRAVSVSVRDRLVPCQSATRRASTAKRSPLAPTTGSMNWRYASS